MTPLRTRIATVALSGSLPEKLEAAAGFGAANTPVRAAAPARQHPAETLFL